MRVSRLVALCVAVSGTVAMARGARAQDSTKGVHIGLTYGTGGKPSVVVLPILGVGGDSARAIVARDLDYGDRINVIANANAPQTADVNYPLFKQLGAAAVVQAFLAPTALHVIVHDVGARKIYQTRDFPVPAAVGSPEWRLAIHAASDQVEQWITGTHGVAATRVLFVRDGQVWVVDSDGWGAHPVTRNVGALSPCWSPDGRYIAYSAFVAKGTVIDVQDLQTNTVKTLVATPGGLNTAPVFAPDGQSLVYAHGDEIGTDLFAANPFTNDPGRRITVGRGTDNTQPTFSPDGRQLAFTSGRSGHPEIYITDVDGTNADLLTPYAFGDENYRSGADWSPDGRVVALSAITAGVFQVMTINLRDRSMKQLTSEGRNEDPSFAPDSRHIVFTSNRTGVKQLWVLDVESGRARQLTFGTEARLAAWSRPLVRAS
jgi:TolB protein